MILITGATGFIGARMAELFKENGDDLILLGRLSTQQEIRRGEDLGALGLTIHDIDLTEHDLAQYTKDVDVIIHLAAAQHEANKPESYFERVNVDGTRRCLSNWSARLCAAAASRTERLPAEQRSTDRICESSGRS